MGSNQHPVISQKELKQHMAGNHGGPGSIIAEIILGGQDGLVNVLGIILGVAVATQDARLVLIAGLAATFAESISMGAVAFTSTRADQAFYRKQRRKEQREITEIPKIEVAEVRHLLEEKGYYGKDLEEMVRLITSNQKMWVDFMMSEELNLAPEEGKQPLRSAAIVGISALVGSLIPLAPFFVWPVFPGLYYSLGVSVLALFITGAYKATITVGDWKKSGLEIMVIGITAALAGYVVGVLLQVPPG